MARAMDDVGAHTIRGEGTPVATLSRRLVLAAVAAENRAYADAFGEPISVEDCVDKVRAIVDMSLGGAPVEELIARALLSTVLPGEGADPDAALALALLPFASAAAAA